jgi:hypothetical protein
MPALHVKSSVLDDKVAADCVDAVRHRNAEEFGAATFELRVVRGIVQRM